MKLYTIGFTKKSAREFFDELLGTNGAIRVLDIRLRPSSQLAGFAKVSKSDGDFQFLLKRLCDMEYEHITELAPRKELLRDYRAGDVGWNEYAERYRAQLNEDQVAALLDRQRIADGVLLCSEHEATHCHRRLAAEYLQEQWGGIEIIHL